MSLNDIVLLLNNIVWSWPLLIFITGTSIVATVALSGVQFRYFVTAWKLILFPTKHSSSAASEMSPIQAFLNALSAAVGNGSIAGMATAVYAGGPGVAFWLFVVGILTMALRYAEVYLSARFATRSATGSALGGPMIYLQQVPGGKYLTFSFAFFCFLLSLATGNAMQMNSIRLGLTRILPVSKEIIAVGLFVFMLYVVLGGARRIVKVSDRIVPVKIGLFFSTAIIILAYHYAAIIPAFKIIMQGAFTPEALSGAMLGLSIQYALRFGISRGLNASEAGLGTAGIFFGGTDSKQPVQDGIMSMLSAFITSNLVCFSVALMLIVSGVWNNGLTSIELTSSAYETVFGTAGSWIVAFLSVSFGIGTAVSYAYVARACWIFMTNGRLLMGFTILFPLATLIGALARVEVVWNATDLINAGLLVSNLLGILYLLPLIRKDLLAYQQTHKN